MNLSAPRSRARGLPGAPVSLHSTMLSISAPLLPLSVWFMYPCATRDKRRTVKDKHMLTYLLQYCPNASVTAGAGGVSLQ